LSHELRQPLSSIESIAYYLEMVLTNAGQEVLDHCAELRRLVEESSWILDDASLAMKLESAEVSPAPAAAILEKLAAQMALHEERNIELIVEPGTPDVLAPSDLAVPFFDHLLRFFRSVAQCADPLRVTLRPESGMVRLAIQGHVGPDPGELTKTIDPQPNGNSVRRFIEAAGGSILFEHGDERFKAVLLFQRAEETA
jgi:signal transduction histidine kinase